MGILLTQCSDSALEKGPRNFYQDQRVFERVIICGVFFDMHLEKYRKINVQEKIEKYVPVWDFSVLVQHISFLHENNHSCTAFL